MSAIHFLKHYSESEIIYNSSKFAIIDDKKLDKLRYFVKDISYNRNPERETIEGMLELEDMIVPQGFLFLIDELIERLKTEV